MLRLSEYSESHLEEFILTHKSTRSEFEDFFDLTVVDNQLPVQSTL